MNFMKIKGKPVVQLQFLEWAQYIAFDITGHFNVNQNIFQCESKYIKMMGRLKATSLCLVPISISISI